MIELKFDPKLGVWAEEPESVEKLSQNWFGELKNGKLWLGPEETLYLVNFQNAVVRERNKILGFNEILRHYIKREPRLFIRYNAYRDWKDRGLIIKPAKELKKFGKTRIFKKYPAKPLKLQKIDTKAYWYPDSFFSIISDQKIGKELFETNWFGQFGVYKQERGSLLKLNWLETIFLANYSLEVLDVEKQKNLTCKEILNQVCLKREFAKPLYEIYRDWRENGYIVKTGFKFGSHFRIYFPSAKPLFGTKAQEYVHSKHVLHVFPKEQKLLISEWARAVRVAHSVKKTFILGIPKLKPKDYISYPTDFLAYRRKKVKGIWVRETPKDKPRYLLIAVSEDEWIGGIELASLLNEANNLGLSLLLSITDRETAITYYVLNRIILPNSSYEYYEIEWMKP